MTAEVEKPQVAEATPAEDLASKEDPCKDVWHFYSIYYRSIFDLL